MKVSCIESAYYKETKLSDLTVAKYKSHYMKNTLVWREHVI